MDETILAYIADQTSLVADEDLFIDESAAEDRNYVLVKSMQSRSMFTGIQIFDTTIIICDVVYDTARSRAATLEALFDGKRGISDSSWGTIGDVVSRYEGTDTMKRTVYTVMCKIGKQED